MTRNEFILKFPGIYYYLRSRKKLSMLDGVIGDKSKRHWTKDVCMKDARQYKSLKEWRRVSPGGYSFACRQKIIQECSSHMTRLIDHGKWDEGAILNAMKKAGTTSKFMKAYPGAYDAAIKLNLLDVHRHLFLSYRDYRMYDTIEKVLYISRQYKTVVSWKTASPGSYHAARRRGWLSKCKEHMISGRGVSSRCKSIIRLGDGKVYASVSAARMDGFLGVSHALKTGQTAGGYRWAYCDENGNILKEGK
jgi:hypothetical protein